MCVSGQTKSVQSTVNDILLRLGRPGARLRVEGDDATIVTPGSGAHFQVSAAAVVALRADELLHRADALGNRAGETLSARGQTMLRQLLMADIGAKTTRLDRAPQTLTRRIQKPRRGRESQSATPERPIERRTVLEQLHLRKDARGIVLLTATQLSAGQRFATDFLLAQMQPRVTAQWGLEAGSERRRRGVPGAGLELPETIASAQARVRAALADLGGMLADMVLDVCAFDRGLEVIEAQRAWPARASRLVLQAALDRLALHYGMIIPVRTSRASVRQWGDGAHKPSAESWLAR
jgi:hypothetical protein